MFIIIIIIIISIIISSLDDLNIVKKIKCREREVESKM